MDVEARGDLAHALGCDDDVVTLYAYFAGLGPAAARDAAAKAAAVAVAQHEQVTQQPLAGLELLCAELGCGAQGALRQAGGLAYAYAFATPN
jgi:hypothetical protein